MSLSLHPALRALGLTLGGLVLLVGGSLAAYSGLKAMAQAGVPVPPAPTAGVAPAQNYIADPAAAAKRIPLLVRQSHGDWSRLSDADRQMLDSMTAGHGRQMLRSLAQKQNANRPQRKE